MYKITVSQKGQIVIPLEIRKNYGLKKGDQLAVEDNNGIITLRPLPKHPFLELRGKYKSSSPTDKLTTALIKERTAERSREKR
ncbi:AbrB/MazE/SpoVT family DNA-binding domain-containing protein [Neomoorella mulderi]|uniref:SpoVT / AbrB like domain protein n=1 Tax=Moorella mulderi DSM 14980 TaxID=1122241 RepID=A0A151AUY0_9FIRM|nr:AbrB/MazE/SpoVT family DNA-binding domain-containing protein [Moorella mulderi]KYH31411.1 SpoVT / AbrB like domain protein [Moorella mulderi DSM 14980]